MTTGLICGRFQPFHMGHMDLIKYALHDGVDELIIVIGSPDKSHTRTDPFTAGERYRMIYNSIQELVYSYIRDEVMPTIHIIPVPDTTNTAWVDNIVAYVPPFSRIYCNEPMSIRLFKEKGFDKIFSYISLDRKIYCASNIRDWINQDIGNWITLVPKETYKVIRDCDGINRIKELNQSDKA